ncbi:MAG: TetR/AcrR family transcriptional regulator [Oricola sp.]
MLQTNPDKRGTILAAALDVFINYGFRKTSMDDIARAAGMSRPALYQVFRNKTEIFRAASLSILESAGREARAAFEGDKPFGERLYDSLDRSILSLHRKIDATPHGAELMGVNEEVAGDIEEQWCELMIGAIAGGISEAARTGEIALEPLGVDAETVATIIMQAMEGMKAKYLRGEPVEDDVRHMVTFVAGALTAGKAAP